MNFGRMILYISKIYFYTYNHVRSLYNYKMDAKYAYCGNKDYYVRKSFKPSKRS